MDKAGIAFPSKDKLPGVVDTLISAVRAGELDDTIALGSDRATEDVALLQLAGRRRSCGSDYIGAGRTGFGRMT